MKVTPQQDALILDCMRNYVKEGKQVSWKEIAVLVGIQTSTTDLTAKEMQNRWFTMLKSKPGAVADIVAHKATLFRPRTKSKPFPPQCDSALLAALRNTFLLRQEIDWKAIADAVGEAMAPEDCEHRWASLVKNRRHLNHEVDEVLRLQRQIKAVCPRNLYSAEEDEKLLRALRDCLEEKRHVCWEEGQHDLFTSQKNTFLTVNLTLQ